MSRIYAPELARIIGQSAKTARRTLAKLEAEHGPSVVGRAGRELFTTWDALERVTPYRRPRAEPRDATSKLIASLRRQVSAVFGLELRVADLEAAVEELRARVTRSNGPRMAVP